MFNKVIMMGRIVNDIELQTTTAGVNVVSFRIAVDRRFQKQGEEKKSDFFNVTVWRQQAEFVCKYATKGRTLVVEGRLQVREWKDRDGNNRRNAEIVAENIYFGDSKRDEGNAADNSAPAGGGYGAPAGGGFSEIADEDETLPF